MSRPDRKSWLTSYGRGLVVQVRAGTGGDEAGIWAGDLTRMYTRYAEGEGWKVCALDRSLPLANGLLRLRVKLVFDPAC